MKKEEPFAPIAPIENTLKEGNNTSVWSKRHHCFTINNFKQSDIDALLHLTKYTKILVAQTEVGEATATNHIQGYMQFEKKERPRRFFAADSTIFFPKDKRGWKGRVKSRVDKACMYCSKPNRGNPKIDWSIRHGWERPEPIIKELFCWEKSLIKLIEKQADNRTIHWVFGDYGCGKTIFAKYLAMEYGYLPLEGGKRHILSVASQNENTQGFTFLLGKASGNFISYEALEKVKDGIFMSHFGCKGTRPFVRRRNVHCIVFANVPPDRNNYHPDKTIIWKIKRKMLTRYVHGCDLLLQELEARNFSEIVGRYSGKSLGF